MKEFKRYMITAALPYANGPIHIGHLAGVYIPADIYVRYLRMRGTDVKFVCGSDEHGVPITIKARNENVLPQVIVDRYHEIIKKSFTDFGIHFDKYSRTTSKVHFKMASDIFTTINDKNGFVEKESEQYYDENANQYLADRYITGTCPHCGNEKAYGDQCEKCGTTLNALDLINPQSVLSGSKPVLRKTKHWYLPLEKHEKWLRDWIVGDHKEWKVNVAGQCKSWLDMGLQPRAVSRDLDWGIPVPLKDADGKVLYVWFDAPIGYISATKELAQEQGFDWELYWKNDDTRLIHFIGKDNIVFHCIVFPAMLKAEGSYILPDNVPANEFLNLEGDKISTSRNWAVWLHEYLLDFKDKQDVLRYTLTANAPETKDNDFTWKDFQDRNNNELVAILGNFVNRTLVLTQKYYEGVVPIPLDFKDYDIQSLKEIDALKKSIEESISLFRFREALKLAMDMARVGNKYLADMEPWKLIKTDAERVKTIMYVALQITANLAIVFNPFLPFTAARLRNFLNMDDQNWDAIGGFANGKVNELIKAGHKINEPVLLFDKIEDDAIELQKQKLAESKKMNAAVSSVQLQRENVSYDDFSKMDIRVGKILEAEKLAKTKKLMKLTIDTGIDKRTVVSGIAEYFEPAQIIGKQVCILINLEPREIKGITSQGMILMAENAEGVLTFVQPDKEFMNGAVVK